MSLNIPQSLIPFLEPYLPQTSFHVTLTYAQSIDAKIASQPGTRTPISHLETKAMTHYLRSRHQGILVGIGTVLADDPKLNCRYQHKTQTPRPIVLDPHGKWKYRHSQLRRVCDQGEGLAPFIMIKQGQEYDKEDLEVLKSQGGGYIEIIGTKWSWNTICNELKTVGISSVMVEGGAQIINEMLIEGEFDSLIVTIGPIYLGNKGVGIEPQGKVEVDRVQWWTGIQDSIMAGVKERS